MGASALAGLRVGLVGPLPPPAGGMANQTRQLAELLASAGVQVSRVPTNPRYRPAWVARVPLLRAACRLLPYVWALWRACGRSDVLHVMANSGWSWHLFAAPALAVARQRGVPVVVNYRGGEAAAFLVRSPRAVQTLRRALARGTRLVVPSGFLQQVFAQHAIAADIVPNVVDPQRFHPAPALPAEPRLAVLRNLEPIYDNGCALRAFALVVARYPEATLTIAGSGPQQAELQALAAELGMAQRVRFAGRLDRDQVAALLRESRIVINPTRVDNTPNSVLEALAAGVPVVSTGVGGVPFIVADGRTALLVPPQDPTALAAAVLRLLDDPALAARLRDNGLREVRRYTWERTAPLLAAIYRGAIAAAATRASPARSA